MNNIRETLESTISTKLPHGGYSGTGKALFDLIKSNLSKLENLQNTKEDKITRTHVPENDSNKVFTGKGALDLKNWIVTAYTNAINTVRDTLQTSINTKLSHGGYSGTAQALVNLINSKINKSDISSSISSTSTSTVANSYAVKLAYDKANSKSEATIKYFNLGTISSNKRWTHAIPSDIASYTHKIVVDTEVNYGGGWGSTGNFTWESSTAGTGTHIYKNQIICRTGTIGIAAQDYGGGSPFGNGGVISSGQARAVILCIK